MTEQFAKMATGASYGTHPARLPATAREWRDYLTEYGSWFEQVVEYTVPMIALSAGSGPASWLGNQPATEEMIAAAEERLGVRLPPSLRGFLRASNGWRHMVSHGADAILACDEIDWFRHTHPGFFADQGELAEREDRRRYEIVWRCLMSRRVPMPSSWIPARCRRTANMMRIFSPSTMAPLCPPARASAS
jgi:hypothetical protein